MPERLQLYTMNTPNGQKVSCALELMGLPYDAHLVNIMKGDQLTPEHLAISPNGKIPALVDLEGDGGEPLRIMESGAIMLHLAELSGTLMPTDVAGRSEALQWLFFQVGHVGPMMGQFGHFYRHAKDKCDHPYPLERYRNETRRLLGVLEDRMAGREWIVGDGVSIVDCAIVPWLYSLDAYYKALDDLGWSDFPNVAAWRARFEAFPEVQVGYQVGAP